MLTEHRAKAAVPFAGVYRLVDFPLSNCQHAQRPDVWVSAQFHPVSLAEHLSNGRGDGDIALIGQAARVPDGHRVPPGGRWPEPEPDH